MNKYIKALVLDVSYMPRSVIKTERAFVIWYKGNCEIIKNHPVSFGMVNKDITYYKPSIIKVGSYINFPHSQKVSLSRENIYKRDNYKCVYCEYDGRKNLKTINLDHIIPQSKGGKHTWRNLVTCCIPCNNEKADLDIEEWGREHPKPKRPHYLMLMKTLDYIPEEWKTYLFF